MNELGAHAVQRMFLKASLFQFGEFSVESLEFLKENICGGCCSSKEFLAELELWELRLTPGAGLSHHDARG